MTASTCACRSTGSRAARGSGRPAALLACGLLALALLAAGCGGVTPPETWKGPDASKAPSGTAPANGAEEPGRAAAPPAGPAASPAAYREEVESFRARKDELFRSGKGSPVPADQRGAFKGLEYYPVDPAWRLVLPLIRDGRAENRTFVSNLGEKRQMRREGHVEFLRDGVLVKLALYHILDDPVPENSLWLGFADAGSGKETYPGGRYIDTELRPDGTVLLDFNYAYNPYCAYGYAFSCPLAPSENRLKIPVRAGEKGFHNP